MAERTLKEQKDGVAKALSPYLTVPSPFTVWSRGEEPVMQVSRVDNYHRTATDIEMLQLKGAFAYSDFFYLMSAACFQFSTVPAICSLVRFWNRKDHEEAARDKRERLIIPDPDEAHASRMRELCRKGVLTRYDCFLDPNRFPVDGDPEAKMCVPVYRANSVGCSIYQAALERKPIAFNLRTAFYTEAEMLRWVQNSVLTAGFLNLPCVKDVKFMYGVTCGRRKSSYMSYLSVENSTDVRFNCNLILESAVLRTNEKLVTRKARVEEFHKRIQELLGTLDEMQRQTGRAHFLVLCVEDAEALMELKNCLAACGGAEYRGRVLVTTGTVLYAKSVAEPDSSSEMQNCFLEYTGSGFTGAVGFYFLQDMVLKQ